MVRSAVLLVMIGKGVIALLLFCSFPQLAMAEEKSERIGAGLLVFYDFAETDGNLIKDKAGAGEPIDLKIEDLKAVFRKAGALEVKGKTILQTAQPPRRLIEAIQKSNEITIEAWIKVANRSQAGPARVVTISKNSNERNVTVGQDGDKFDFRLRTDKTSINGIPSINSQSKTVTTGLQHVVYSRDRTGKASIYLNGKLHETNNVAGSTRGWDGNLKLALANEFTKDRPWQGTYYLVAIYGRSLNKNEVEQNFSAGAGAGPSQLAIQKINPNVQRFEQHVAPIIAKHCLECHDTVTHEGNLDLSLKTAAFKGGDSGKVITPKSLKESLVWTSIEADEMPHDRPPLNAEEKQYIKDWIAGGADWTLEAIDPAIYVHDNRAAENWVRRLTIPEYIETVRSATDVDITKEARELLPPDTRADGFSNTAYNLNVDLKHVDAYANLAEIIVQKMDVVQFAKRFSNSQKFTDKDMGKLVENMGKWLLRGPLEEREVIGYRGISTTVASAGGNFEEAVSYMLQAMLQSPRFIYRIEQQPTSGSWPVTDFELASRLSYILWGAPPDAELLKVTESGNLNSDGELQQQLDRMLQDSRAIERSKQFVSEWLNLGRLRNMKPNAERFPKWNQELANDMRAETLAFFEDLVWKQKRPLSNLLNADFTYVTPRLAEHYNLKADLNVNSSNDLGRVDLSNIPERGGLLTHGSVQTIGGDEASMVTRGLFVMHDLLRGVVKDPPPCVDTTPVPTKAGLTQRSIAEARLVNISCGGCHAKFEPLAFGLEKYDGLGSFFEKDEHGNPLREDGEILIPGQARPQAYDTSKELMELLAKSDRVQETITWKLTQYAMGRPLVASDAATVQKIHSQSQKNGGTYQSLISAIVLSDLVRKTTNISN